MTYFVENAVIQAYASNDQGQLRQMLRQHRKRAFRSFFKWLFWRSVTLGNVAGILLVLWILAAFAGWLVSADSGNTIRLIAFVAIIGFITIKFMSLKWLQNLTAPHWERYEMAKDRFERDRFIVRSIRGRLRSVRHDDRNRT